MKAIGERIGQNVVKLQTSISDRPHTIVHADFRTDNLFFASPQGGPDFAVVDWQIACRGRGIFDVAYLLCGGLEAGVRRANEERLVRMYHDTLVANGVRDYGWDQCWREYRRMALYVFVYVVISLGTLDPANERGVRLMQAWLRRSSAAIEDLRSVDELPA
jgi:aminoglycoside/choline kinase family phosphotransferase